MSAPNIFDIPTGDEIDFLVPVEKVFHVFLKQKNFFP